MNVDWESVQVKWDWISPSEGDVRVTDLPKIERQFFNASAGMRERKWIK